MEKSFQREMPRFVVNRGVLHSRKVTSQLRRGDFSRWIADVFGDRALARELQRLEREYVESRPGDVVARIAAAVKSRYDLTDENDSVIT